MGQHLPGRFELVAGLPRSMEGRFRLRHIPVQPVSQPSVKLARGFAFHPAAHAKESPSALKLSSSGTCLLELSNDRQKLDEILLGQFFVEPGLLPTLVLQSYLVRFTICFSVLIHTTSVSANQG
jgi:hypothetical protein